ncbi:MAG TPA: glycosyltransferase family 4 protein [Candidatus Humimicrobiaceae bacterium]|nr:glycosyltransferase family 4 protein [Candidatus Humimicrobiaceae bacterium]
MENEIKLCFLSDSIFNWGRYGGYGKLTRDLGRELAKRGFPVSVAIPKSSNQRIFERLDGMKIIGYPKLPSKTQYLSFFLTYRFLIDADIFHSTGESIFSYIAIKSRPGKRHIITLQDPRDDNDWKVIYTVPGTTDKKTLEVWKDDTETFEIGTKTLFRRIREKMEYKAVKQADALYCQAKYLGEKVRNMYNLDHKPEFLPNPIYIPEHEIQKSGKPTVCFLGRLDIIKRPWIFFNLAKEFPEIDFIVMGKSHYPQITEEIYNAYSRIKNLEFKGWSLGEEKSKILGRSWILINTSIHECLPISFLEALSYKCALLSCQDPDNLTSKYGIKTDLYDFDSFKDGLNKLIENNHWKKKGELGYQYVKKIHEVNKVIDKHIKIYENVLR